jgi:hypothetical protein
MTMPNFLIIGAMKSGTTALYYYLEQHPEIYMSPVKEPNFFSSQEQENAADTVTHIGTYQHLFRGVSGKKLSVKRPIPTFTNRRLPLNSDATSLRPSSSLSFEIRSTGPTRASYTWCEAVRSLSMTSRKPCGKKKLVSIKSGPFRIKSEENSTTIS